MNKSKFISITKRYENLIKYILIGGVCASLDFIFFNIFTSIFKLNSILSNIISVNVGILVSFYFNRKHNFKVLDFKFIRFLKFYSTGVTGLLISTGVLYLFVTLLKYNEVIIKLITIPLVVVLQFTINKFYTFKSNKGTYSKGEKKIG